MVLPGDREPWKRDDVLVSALSVEWIAKNVFLVAVPSYRRKVSCELTAVDGPRGTAPALTERVCDVLQRVNSAMRLYLRQDFYSNFPLEGYGDVIFSAETKQDTPYELHWCSLQETLVRAGVACVVRPSVIRQEALLQAEEEPTQEVKSSGASSWLHELQQREHSPLFCLERRCVVEDVMRGDVYRVSWLTDAAGTATERLASSPAELPPLLILDATVCHAVSTQPGFAALRWAQLHVLHRELVVQVHGVYPSDKDVAFNTQLETYEYLANVRGSAGVLDAEGERRDIGVTLIRQGLAWVRRVADAGVPRASNLFDLFRAVDAAAAEEATTAAAVPNRASNDTTLDVLPEVDVDACAALGKAWGLSAAAAAGLLDWHGERWRRAGAASMLHEPISQLGEPSRVAPKPGITAEAWNRFMWCADLHRDPNDEPRVYQHRPLRTLFPLAGLAEWRVRLQGQLEGAVVVNTDDGRHFLQVEVMATTPAVEWRELRRSYGYADLDVVRFSPTPGDVVLGKKVRVVITASSFGQNAEPRLRVCCTSYPASSFSLAQHKPSDVWPVMDGGRCEEELSIDGTAKEERVFVLDVVVETRDEDSMTWTQRGTGRAVYLLSPDVESDAAEATTHKDADDKPNSRSNDAESETRKHSTALQPSFSYFCKMSFFFELDAPAMDADSDAGTGGRLLSLLKQAFSELMYEDVVILPVGVAEVCGVRGLVGDLLFPSEPAPRTGANPTLRTRAPVLFARSLLSAIGQAWWPRETSSGSVTSTTPWPMSSVVYAAVLESFRVCLEKVEEEEWAARQSFLKEVEWHYQLLDQEALNTFLSYRPPTPFKMSDIAPPARSTPQRCLRFTAGHSELWRDGAAAGGIPRLRFPASILPPTVPLSLFAVRPRELFSVATTQKMTVVTQAKNAPPPKTLQEVAYNQQDWAFMRLNFPFLPNILHCDWERLPLSLRNTERGLCESIVRDGNVVREPGMLYTTDRIFSLLLSYLALLQCMQVSCGSSSKPDSSLDPSSSALASVYVALRQSTPSIWDDCKSALHFSATLFVLPSYGAGGDAARAAPHSRPLFLGSRDNVVTDAFEVPRRDNASPETVSFPLLRDLTTQCVSALALESLVESELEAKANDGEGRATTKAPTAASVTNLDEGRRPDQLRLISNQGLPWRPAQASTPILYHPLPRVAVLASPLVEREEYTADALGRLHLDRDSFAGVKAACKDEVQVRRRVVLQYRCLNQFSEKSPYKTISYGRASSVDMFRTLINDRARGKEIQAYMSLLLRRNVLTGVAETVSGASCDAAPLADGLLTLYGVPAEPLYVHYRSRADLRFTLSTICPPLRRALLQAEQNVPPKADVVEEAETALFGLYAEAAARYVRKVYERVRREQKSADAVQQISLFCTLQPWDDTIPPYIAIQVFPVYATEAETTARVLDQESIWHDPATYQNNPHRAFSLVGSRFGRLPLAELRIHYDVAKNRFGSSWNEMFESTLDPAPPSS
ncbi:RNA Interference Factor 5 [Leptomonas pyrrhocoris]|uniref:RNA Interference Factor 5 n=1 Tax=Leptomonas pyrrhocoris TaxID=157538 RepID=A0A0M9FVD3_LEPPY|nr:RNA Interference Factor 5 [Leptomonas pyrrhocoris]KPA76850.1 RNA Interference Factor 5 [Leptomonas pyrrhocoris]|eukprot:XP_015655289.1 RNA Interference Factor 5 [Leptomonas pyrrhocoris]